MKYNLITLVYSHNKRGSFGFHDTEIELYKHRLPFAQFQQMKEDLVPDWNIRARIERKSAVSFLQMVFTQEETLIIGANLVVMGYGINIHPVTGPLELWQIGTPFQPFGYSKHDFTGDVAARLPFRLLGAYDTLMTQLCKGACNHTI